MDSAMSEVGWRPLTQADLTEDFVEEQNKENPDLGVVRNWFDTHFEEQTGLSIDFTDNERIRLYATWLSYQILNSELTLFSCENIRSRNFIFPQYSYKISTLAQRFCHICRPNGPSYFLPIRITPRSWQSIKTIDRIAFKAAIAYWASSRQITIDPTKIFCLAVTFILDERRRDKDLDNMVKIFQDAIADALKFNDRNVHHLDLLKLIMPVEEEYVCVRIRNSQVNEHHDVLAPIEHHIFACGPPLNLEDFVRPNISE